MVSSFGAESAVLLDMVASIDRRTPVVFLETGKLFPETLAFKDELVDLAAAGGRALDPARRRPTSRGSDPDGTLWRREPDLCCHIRKTEPLGRGAGRLRRLDHRPQALPGRDAHGLPAVETDPVTGQLKLNPLATWSPDDIRHYRRAAPAAAASAGGAGLSLDRLPALHARRSRTARTITRRPLVAARQDRVRHPPRRGHLSRATRGRIARARCGPMPARRGQRRLARSGR